MPATNEARASRQYAAPARPGERLRICFVLLVISLPIPAAFGQETSPAVAPSVVQSGARPAPLLPGEIGPSTYLLPDKEGHLQRVLGFTYEDMVEAYRIQQRLPRTHESPGFFVQRLMATGTAEDGHARLRIDVTIVINTAQAVNVPLAMPEALLITPLAGDRPDKVSIHFDATAGGYVARLHGSPGETHQIVLNVLVPLVNAGDETALQIGMPRAAMSQLTLTVPVANATAQVGRGAAVVAQAPVPEGTRLAVAGMGGAFRLAWRETTQATADRGTVLEASGTMLVRVDGFTISTDIRLSVRSFGSRFDRFRVRLPPATDLVAVHHPGYSVTPIDQGTDQQTALAAGQVVEVRLDETTAGPVDVQLITQQRQKPNGRERVLQLAGFEVLGAVRQFGHIAVQVIGDWHVQWTERQGIFRVDELPESVRRDDVVAGFEYFRQPFALAGRLIPRRTDVRVEPEYLVLVGANQATLEAHLRYTVRVKKAFVFHIDLAGWQCDPATIGPPNLFDHDAASVNDNGLLSIPLLTPTKGQIELTIRLNRPLPDTTGGIRLSMPVPQDVATTPATIVLLPDDNVQLIPTPEEISGLTPQPTLPPVKLPHRQQSPLCYRGDAEQARFAGQIRVHTRSVLVDMSTRLQIDRRGGQVDQTLDYQIAYEPANSLILSVPREVARRGNLQIQLDNDPLPFAIDPSEEDQPHESAPTQDTLASDSRAAPAEPPTAAPGDAAAPENIAATAEAPVPTGAALAPPASRDRVRLQVALPEPKIGALQLAIHFHLVWPESLTDHDTAVDISLPEPAAEVDQNLLTITPAQAIQVAVRGDTWTKAPTTTDGMAPASQLRLVAAGKQAALPLTLRSADQRPLQSTIVERLWIQTWLTGRARQDRAVYLLRTNASQLTVALPNQVAPNEFMALLDGVPVTTAAPVGGNVTVHFADTQSPSNSVAAGRQHRLEIRCLSPSAIPRIGSITLNPAQLDQDIWIQHAYWEVILPRGRHLLDVRGDVADEWHWQWRRFGWRRIPALTSAQLELWSGAALDVRIPASAHRYLFSSVGRVARMSVQVADRSLFVLIASSGALLAGLLFVYVPAARKPRVLLAGLLLVLVLAASYPDAAILSAQAALLGFVLVGLAAWLKLILGGRPQRDTLLVSGSGSSVIGPISTTDAFAASAAIGGSSAATRRVIAVPSDPSR